MSTPLELAVELEVRDARLAAEIEEAASLERRAAAVGERATELARLEQELPAERARLEGAVVASEQVLAEREDARRRAERELEQADEDDQPAARRALVHAKDLESVARRALESTRSELRRLEERAAAAADELPRLHDEAHELTGAIARGTVPEPGRRPEDLREWASRASAALLVARSGLETQRERVVREANELAAVALGEAGATSVAGVVERLRRRG